MKNKTIQGCGVSCLSGVKKLDGGGGKPLFKLDDDILREDEEKGQAGHHGQNLDEPHDDFHAWNIQMQSSCNKC